MSQAAWSDGCALFYLNSKGSEKVFIHIELTAIFIYKNKNLSKLGIEDNSLNLIKKKKGHIKTLKQILQLKMTYWKFSFWCYEKDIDVYNHHFYLIL